MCKKCISIGGRDIDYTVILYSYIAWREQFSRPLSYFSYCPDKLACNTVEQQSVVYHKTSQDNIFIGHFYAKYSCNKSFFRGF